MTKSERKKWQQQAEPGNACAAHDAALTLLPGVNENVLKVGFTGLRP